MSDYYNLEKAAEVLQKTTGDLNRLRESGKIRAFRDGATWKFLKKDIDNYLTDEIKARSSSIGDDDLLSGMDDEEEDMPTRMAETNTFDLDQGFEIKARDPEDADVVVAGEDDIDEDGFVLGDFSGDSKTSSSSISLDDDDDDDDFASGISILDENSGSNVDLASDSGLSLDSSGFLGGSQSGSGSGISILEEDEEESAASQDDFELDPFPSDDVPEKQKEVKNFDQPAAAEASESTDEIFELQPLEEDTSAGGGDTYGVAGDNEESDVAAEGQESAEEDEFKLEPLTSEDDSDTESSSQMLDLAEDTSSMLDLEETKSGDFSNQGEAAAPESDSFDGGADSFADAADAFAGGDFGGDGFGGMESGDASDDAGFGDSGMFTEESGDVTADDSDASWGETGTEVQVEKKTEDTSGYSSLGIWLGLVPCILLLVLAGTGVWELIRTMWSWDQDFSLSGPVLETIGNLFKLIK